MHARPQGKVCTFRGRPRRIVGSRRTADARRSRQPREETSVTVPISLTVNGKATDDQRGPAHAAGPAFDPASISTDRDPRRRDTAQCEARARCMGERPRVKACSRCSPIAGAGRLITTMIEAWPPGRTARCRPRSASATACSAGSTPGMVMSSVIAARRQTGATRRRDPARA